MLILTDKLLTLSNNDNHMSSKRENVPEKLDYKPQ